MKALTLYQPWAALVVLGIKQVETRTWNTNYRGRVLIHASKRYDRDMKRFTQELAAIYLKDSPEWFDRFIACLLPTGALIGAVDIAHCQSAEEWKRVTATFGYKEDLKREKILGDLSNGRYAWTLKDPAIFPEPIPAKGALGLWNYEDNINGN